MLETCTGSASASVEQEENQNIPEVSTGGVEAIRRMEVPWRQLCKETRCDPFFRPEWIAAYICAFEPKSEVVLVTAHAGDRLTAVLPLVRKRGFFAGMPVVKLMAPANSHSVRFDILRAIGPTGDAAIDAIWRFLKSTPGWHLLELPTFPAEGSCQQLMSYAARDGYRTMTRLYGESPYLRMQADSSGRLNWQAETSRHFRHELRRFARVLETQAGGIPKLVRRDQPDPEVLRQFFQLEASGWKGTEGSALNCKSETLAFYGEIARVAAHLDQFCLHSLEADGKMLAGAFSLVTTDCYYPMKIAYDESFHRGGPGQLLINSILEECSQRGIPELHFGGSKDHYKTMWTSATRRHLTGLVFNDNSYPLFLHHVRTKLAPALKPAYSFVHSLFRSKNRKETAKTSHERIPASNAPANSHHG